MTATNENNLLSEGKLDPQIDHFIREIGKGWSKYPPLGSLPFPEARKVADAVRKPWTEGGPKMALTQEIMIPFESGDIRIRIYNPGPLGTPKW